MRYLFVLVVLLNSIYPMSFAKQNWKKGKAASLWVSFLVISADTVFLYFLFFSPVSIIK